MSNAMPPRDCCACKGKDREILRLWKACASLSKRNDLLTGACQNMAKTIAELRDLGAERPLPGVAVLGLRYFVKGVKP